MPVKLKQKMSLIQISENKIFDDTISYRVRNLVLGYLQKKQSKLFSCCV